MKALKLRVLGAAAGLFSAMLVFPALAANQAVVIGVSDYTDMPDLPDAAADARETAKMLKAAGFELPLANDREQGSGATLNPTRAEISEILDDSGAFRKAEVVFVYFAGHGGQVGKEIYLLGSDAKAPKAFDGDEDSAKAESSGLRRNGIAISEFPTSFKPRGGKGIALMVDACRSGNKATDDGPQVPDDCILICSTEARKVAQNGEGAGPSRFTKVVLAEVTKGQGLLKTMENAADRFPKDTDQRPSVYIQNKTSRIAHHVLFPKVPKPAVRHALSGSFTFKGNEDFQYPSKRSVEITTREGVPEGYATVTFTDSFPPMTYKGRVVFLGSWNGKTYSGEKQRVIRNDYKGWPEERFTIRFADDFSSASGEFEFWSSSKNAWIKASGTFSK
jgi:hypothetical protein